MIPAPASWAVVDAPPPPRRQMDVIVDVPEGRVAYRARYRASMDAYGHALQAYPGAVRITVTPVPREVQA